MGPKGLPFHGHPSASPLRHGLMHQGLMAPRLGLPNQDAAVAPSAESLKAAMKASATRSQKAAASQKVASASSLSGQKIASPFKISQGRAVQHFDATQDSEVQSPSSKIPALRFSAADLSAARPETAAGGNRAAAVDPSNMAHESQAHDAVDTAAAAGSAPMRTAVPGMAAADAEVSVQSVSAPGRANASAVVASATQSSSVASAHSTETIAAPQTGNLALAGSSGLEAGTQEEPAGGADSGVQYDESPGNIRPSHAEQAVSLLEGSVSKSTHSAVMNASTAAQAKPADGVSC